MKNIKKVLFASLLATIFASSASAYTLTVVNGTDEDVAFDPGGYAVAGGSLIQGKIKHITGQKIHDIVVRAGTTYYKNAGAIPLSEFAGGLDKPIIKPGETAVFEFTDIDVGVCFDYSNTKVGLASENYSMRPRKLKVADDELIDSLISKAKGISKGVTKIGKGVAQASQPEAQAVGGVVQGLGKLWDKSVDWATGNGCGNRSMLIVKDADKPDSPLGIFVSKG